MLSAAPKAKAANIRYIRGIPSLSENFSSLILGPTNILARVLRTRAYSRVLARTRAYSYSRTRAMSPRPLLKYGENVETRKPPRALFQNSAMIERYIIPTWLPLCREFDRPVLLLEGQT